MTRFAKLFFWFLVVVLVLWQLPRAINYLTAKPQNTPFTIYSEVLGDFVHIERSRENGGKPRYFDRRGHEYTRREFDSLLPLFYARQLVADGRFPDSIAGRSVSPRQAQTATFVFRSVPQDINAPRTGLYFLLESLSGRVDLEMPPDAFRLTDRGIEFIDMASNRIEAGKSGRFTEMMIRKGVRFPIRTITGNPTARKEYDQGYVLLDADRRLFQLKMAQGRPSVRAIETPADVQFKHLFITEFHTRRTLALLTDTENRLYAVTMPGYALRRIEGVGFDPERESMSIIGTLMNWTVCVEGSAAERYYAVSSDDLSLLDTLRYPLTDRHVPGVTFIAPADRYVKPGIR